MKKVRKNGEDSKGESPQKKNEVKTGGLLPTTVYINPSFVPFGKPR